MRGLAKRRGCERPLRLGLAPLKVFVFKETSAAKRVQEMLFKIARVEIAGEPDQVGAQIEPVVLAIEEFETTDQRGRDDQRRIGKAERVADHKSGFVLQGRRHEIETGAEPGQHAKNHQHTPDV